MEKVFSDNEVNMVYSMYDRMVVGGAKPVGRGIETGGYRSVESTLFPYPS